MSARITASTTAALMIALSAVLLAGGMAIPAGIGRAVIVLPVLALAPGWAVQTVAGRRGRGDVAVQLGLAVLLSLAVEIAVGLALAAAGVKLTAGAEAGTLAGLLAILAAVAGVRSRTTSDPATARYWRPWLGAVAVLAVLGGTTGGILAVSQAVRTRPANDTPWTGLTLTGAAARGEALTAAPGAAVRLQAVVTDQDNTALTVPATLSVNGQLSERATVHAGRGGREVVQFDLTAPSQAGSYAIEIATGGSTVDATLEVK